MTNYLRIRNFAQFTKLPQQLKEGKKEQHVTQFNIQ